jgi:DNA processing protein
MWGLQGRIGKFALIVMDHQECLHRLALARTGQIGAQRQRALIQELGSATAVFSAGIRRLSQVPGISNQLARSIKAGDHLRWAEEELKRIEKSGIRMLSFDGPDYPSVLATCADAPALLFCKGEADLQAKRMLAVIGTRVHTDYGRRLCEEMVAGLAGYGVSIVSGMAYGIDALAHRAALKHDLPTIGVLANGLGTLYPPAHKPLASDMLAKGGALLSEYFCGEQAEKGNFPARNRIVAGLCEATLVIETDVKGGSMITASMAWSYNRDVFCVPGRVGDPKSAGCLELIQSLRAQLVTSAEDIARALNWKEKPAPSPQMLQGKLFPVLAPDEEQVLQVLKEKGRLHLDELSLLSGLDPSRMSTALLSLEMQDLLAVQPGKLVALAPGY